MGIFHVTAINNPDGIESAVKTNFANSHYPVPGTRSWFIDFNGTTKELSDVLGITTGQSGTGIILGVTTYFGRAPTDMWEWIKTRLERQ